MMQLPLNTYIVYVRADLSKIALYQGVPFFLLLNSGAFGWLFPRKAFVIKLFKTA